MVLGKGGESRDFQSTRDLSAKRWGGMGMYMRCVVIATCILGLLLAAHCMAEEGVIGSIHNVAGKVVVVRAGAEIKAEPGLRLKAGDVLQTGANGTAGIVLWDDSTLSMGTSSQLELTEFRFKPAQKDYALVLRMVKGTFVYVPGRIAKLAPDSVRIETPGGLATVQGTKLLAKVK